MMTDGRRRQLRPMTDADDPVPAHSMTANTTPAARTHQGRNRSGTAALYVRIPISAGDKLDRAVFELRDHKVTKQDIVAALIERYVDASTPPGQTALRELLDSYQASQL